MFGLLGEISPPIGSPQHTQVDGRILPNSNRHASLSCCDNLEGNPFTIYDGFTPTELKTTPLRMNGTMQRWARREKILGIRYLILPIISEDLATPEGC